MAKKETNKKKGKHGAADGRADLLKFDPNKVVIIGHDTPDGPEHYQCDVESNAKPLVEETVLFTMRRGVIQPVVGQRDGDLVIITAGRGRTRHLREANKRLVEEGKDPWLLPVIIMKGDEATMFEIRLAENSHRREISPFSRAQDAQTLLNKGKSPHEVAVAMGVTVQQLNKGILPLLDLAQPVVNAVKAGKIGPSAAVAALSKLPREQQVKRLAELTADGTKPTVREASNRAREADGKPRIETPSERLRQIHKLAVAALGNDEVAPNQADAWQALRDIKRVCTVDR